MKTKIIGLSGLTIDEDGNKCMAGAGKDVVADYLVEKYHFTKVSLADVMKRFLREVFHFSEDQLWGSSELRNKGDKRYPRTNLRVQGEETNLSVEDLQKHDPELCARYAQCLSPRYALQTLGTEYGRNCYADVWVDYVMNIAKELIVEKEEDKRWQMYTPQEGLVSRIECTPTGEWERDDWPKEFGGVVIPDLRFHNEKAAVRRRGGECWRVVRTIDKIDPTLLSGHPSETQLLNDQKWDCHLANSGTIEVLLAAVDTIMKLEGSPYAP